MQPGFVRSGCLEAMHDELPVGIRRVPLPDFRAGDSIGEPLDGVAFSQSESAAMEPEMAKADIA